VTVERGASLGWERNQAAVVFDFMGVIFREGKVLSKLLIPMFRPPLSFEEIQKRYHRFAIGEIRSEEFWLGMVSDSRKAEQAYLEHFELNDGFEVVQELRSQYTLAVLSEVPAEWGDYLVAKFDLGSVFDVMVLSGKVGLTKPDMRIYQAILDTLGRDRTYYFIDDNHENLKVASSLGWKTIWMMNHAFALAGYRPDMTIEDLRELKELLLET
jgi:HAD superfamily hydrolase (TIGR01509 family)